MQEKRLLRVLFYAVGVVLVVGVLLGYLTLRQTDELGAQSVTVLYVREGAAGGDGSQKLPFGSIQQAINADKSAVEIRVSVGTYREMVSITGADGLALIAEPGTVVSAFDIVAGWQTETDGTFSASVPAVSTSENIWPNDVIVPFAAAIRSPVYRDGVLLYPVPGKPATNEFSVRGGRLYLATTGRVEYGVRRFAINVTNSTNISIAGLAVEGCANHIGTEGCLQIQGSNTITITGVTATRGSYAGLQVNNSRNVTVRDFVGNDNGVRGLGASTTEIMVVENAEMRRNGWRTERTTAGGNSKPLTFWDGGNKFFQVVNVTLRGIRVDTTYGAGLWFDWRNQRVVVEDAVVVNSFGAGIFVEAHCEGDATNNVPVTLRRVRIERTRNIDSNGGYLNADLFITGTNFAKYTDVVIVSNALNAVLINNYSRNVGSCSPVAGSNQEFTGLVVQRLTTGSVFKIVNDGRGAARTTLVQMVFNFGTLSLNGAVLQPVNMQGQLRGGSILTEGVSPAQLTPTPTPSPTNPPTLVTQPATTEQPTSVPNEPTEQPTQPENWVTVGVWRITIEIKLEKLAP